MTRFLVGLLLGALVGIAGTAAFLIVYGGGDYLVSTSPRVKQLEAQLGSADEDRDWLKARLRDATETTHRLESRFDALAARFERLASGSLEPAPAATRMPTHDRGAIGALPSPVATAGPDSAQDLPAATVDEDEARAPGDSLDAIPTIGPAAAPTPTS